MEVPRLIELVKNNIVQHGHPLGLSGSELANWSKNLEIRTRGDVLFYTGGEYQLLPLLDSLVNTISLFEPGNKVFNLALSVREVVGKAGFTPEKTYGKVLGKDAKRYNDIPRKAAAFLQKAGVDLCHLGNKEIYSGALLKEFGYEDDFCNLANRLSSLIKETGSTKIVCLSPHSAEMFKFYYPEVDPWFKEVEVLTFAEFTFKYLPDVSFNKRIESSVTVHDSCKMIRELNCGVDIRSFLRRNEIQVLEPPNNSQWTICCGGPSKILFPQLADTLGERRFAELGDTGADVLLTFCPYCLAALEKGKAKNSSSIRILDFVEYLYEGEKT
jgi:dimethylglycine catabolism B